MVTVLLAAFNGEKYIGRQLDSILKQTYTNVKIVIRDDGSSDSTPQILNQYAEAYPDKIEICPTDYPTGSASGNFFRMLQIYSDDYIMFSDQDDIWLPEKIEKTLKAMQYAENKSNKNTPILVHTDLCVVDNGLKVIADSFMNFEHLSPHRCKLNNLLMQNCVTGCTVMMNRALKERLFRLPERCLMHDWWVAIVAAATGKIVFVDTPLILYRQHTNNQVGAQDVASFKFLISKLKNSEKNKEIYRDISYQSKFLADYYSDFMSRQDLKMALAVAELPKMSRLDKIKTIRRYGLQKNTLLRTFAQYLLI